MTYLKYLTEQCTDLIYVTNDRITNSLRIVNNSEKKQCSIKILMLIDYKCNLTLETSLDKYVPFYILQWLLI